MLVQNVKKAPMPSTTVGDLGAQVAAAEDAEMNTRDAEQETNCTVSCWEHDRQGPITGPLKVIYCKICGLPPDYCEFGGQADKCIDWLQRNHAELLPYALSPEALDAHITFQKKSKNCSQEGETPYGSTAVNTDGAGQTESRHEVKQASMSESLEAQLANLMLSAAATEQAAAAGRTSTVDKTFTATGGYMQTVVPSEKRSSGRKEAADACVSIQRQNRSKRKTMTVVTGLDLFGVKLEHAAKLFSRKFACGTSVSKAAPKPHVEIQGDVEEALVDYIKSAFDVPEESIVVLERK